MEGAGGGGATSSANTKRLPVIWLGAGRGGAEHQQEQPGDESSREPPSTAAASGSIEAHSSGRPIAASTIRHTSEQYVV